MLKFALLLIAACINVIQVTAHPGYLHGHHHLGYPHIDHYHEPLHLAKVVQVPAAISHQSSTTIHTAPYHVFKPLVLKTILHPAPIIKTYHTVPSIKAYHPAPFHYDFFHQHLH